MDGFRNGAIVLTCAGLDGVLAWLLLSIEHSPLSMLVTLGAHLLVCVAASIALADTVPRFVRVSRKKALATAALLTTFVPCVGAVGLFAVLHFALVPVKRVGKEPWVVFDLRKEFEEAHRHPLRSRKAPFSAVEIAAALRQRSEETVAYRFQAVLAIKKLPPKIGVPLLKLAQSDPSDEIRLYAFSRLERMRDGLETQVKELTASLAKASEEESARIHLRLAERYWELGYLGLAEGAVLEHALKSAHKHAAIASELMPRHAPAEFFLGRILVHLREAERALIAFERAIAAGYPRVKLLPWLAECAFYLRDFSTVRAYLRELEATSPENVFFQEVVDFWADKTSERPPPPPGSRRSLLELRSSRSVPRIRLT